MPDDSSPPYLIVGLGNPGPKYAHTRHNVGFMVVDALSRRYGLRFSTMQANAEIARGEIAGERAILAKPQTYMNLSGNAVAQLARFYKIPHDRLLVVYDDVALPLGTLRIREKGSAGGHNGIESIIRQIGTQGFPRLRVGVDQPVVQDAGRAGWVLGRFTKDEQRVMEQVVPRAADAIETILRDGIQKAMNTYNTREGVAPTGEPPLEKIEKPPKGEPPTHEKKVNRWVAKLRSIYGKEPE